MHIITAELTPSSRNKLLLALGGPKYKKVFCEHLTLAFKPTPETLTLINVIEGEDVNIHLLTRFWDNGIEAVLCEIFKSDKTTKVYCANKYPHITISTDDKPPKFSNDLLANRNSPSIQSQDFSFLTLTAKITIK